MKVWGLWSEIETLNEGLSIPVRKAAANMHGLQWEGERKV